MALRATFSISVLDFVTKKAPAESAGLSAGTYLVVTGLGSPSLIGGAYRIGAYCGSRYFSSLSS